jgi:hypothetical protein
MPDLARYKQDNPSTDFEQADWKLRPVAFVAISTFLLLAITPFILMAAFPHALPDAQRRLRVLPPPPRLETNTSADLARLRAKQAKELNSYYWIDRQKGIVHIPIDLEMKKLAQSGIAGFPKATP